MVTRPAVTTTLDSGPRGNPDGDLREHEDHRGKREEAHARPERVMVENRLQHLSRHEHEPEHGEEERHDRDHRGAEARVAEEAEVQHRTVCSAFPAHEGHEPDDGDQEACDNDGLGPSPLGAFRHRVEERSEADDRQPGATGSSRPAGGVA